MKEFPLTNLICGKTSLSEVTLFFIEFKEDRVFEPKTLFIDITDSAESGVSPL